ncbi:hypothetical protein LTS15_006446 [Exophiala xenobiotica]|nr:hypothetical protein LTS15_006446 [Exophiala xenobiotica]
MKLFAFAPVAFAALFTSVMADSPGLHDANDGCWAMCEADKGAPKNAMKTSAIGCEGLTGDVCEASCSCDRSGKNGEGVMTCDNKKVPGCSVDAVTKTCLAGLDKEWHCWCHALWGKGCAWPRQ